ncbi:MAG: HAD family acid phosphatase [Candidatus Binatia bacterium]|nr:HAD family acid phosphatase [Candidatus Binatia bacterium]
MRAAESEHRRAVGAGPHAIALALALSLAACGLGSRPPAVTLVPAKPAPEQSAVRLADGSTLTHLAETKAQIIEFHDSGEWAGQINQISAQATARLETELPTAKRPAIVLDIDDTALSTFAIQRKLGFGWDPGAWDEWVSGSVAPPHAGVLALYRRALDQGVAVFFVTGRREHLREATERQLHAAGYGRWVGLHLKPDDYDLDSAVPYKTAARRAIQEQGFEILVNVGDQWSDLEGGLARATYKLPNPMYYRP